MNKELCLIHANCQGDSIANFLREHKQFSEQYEVHKYTNYLKENIPEQDFKNCSLFIYQHLGDKWNDLSSANLLSKINKHAKSLCIPNLLFKGYWPFWTNKSPYDFADFFLDKLISMGLNKAEILKIYLDTPLSSKFDLQAMFEESVEIEKNKEKISIFQSVDFILQNYKKTQLFSTINHPGQKLIVLITEAILKELNFPELEPTKKLTMQLDYPEFDLPIHPQVIDFHGLKFIQKTNKFKIFGKEKSFEEYTFNYIDCRLLKLESFLVYLHLV